jgi:hypothetical protein
MQKQTQRHIASQKDFNMRNLIAEFKTKNVYGNELIYPVTQLACNLCKLANKKTLTKNELELISKMGILVSLDAQTITLSLN